MQQYFKNKAAKSEFFYHPKKIPQLINEALKKGRIFWICFAQKS